MKIYLFCILLLPLVSLSILLQEVDVVTPYRAAAIERWEPEIQKLEELDKREHYPDDAVLFIGSSSIRRWESIAEDMAPWKTIRRGYGGARFSDLAVFVDRLVQPHEFSALVIFVGNDIAGKPEDKEPEEVVKLFEHIVGRVRVHHKEQPIFLLAVTPTSSRFEVWPEINRMNKLLEDFCKDHSKLHFIDTSMAFLGPDGTPRDELFVKDLLHLNREGYRLWAGILQRELERVLEVNPSQTDSD